MVQRSQETGTTTDGRHEVSNTEIEAARRAGEAATKHAVEDAPEEEVDVDPTDVDEILKEIDDVLEANAVDFVKGFVQKGGQ